VIPGLLRLAAVALAIAAWLDPAISSARAARPLVSVVVADVLRDGELFDRVVRELERDFTVVRASLPAADAAVIVGTRVPASVDDLPSPVFAVLNRPTEPSVSIEAVDVPRHAQADARIPVVVRAHVIGARGSDVVFALRSRGAPADRQVVTMDGDSATMETRLGFVPGATGLLPLEVSVSAAGMEARASAMTFVEQRRWSVLFFDARPSWMSTFVRRVVEGDPRFVVTSRVMTSRGIATETGRPPADLSVAGSIEDFDAVVIGAPEGLSAGDVAALERYLRGRGGNVVLLLDRRVAGPWDRLGGVSAWHGIRLAEPTRVRDADPGFGGLMATTLAWPAVLPAGASAVAADSAGGRPIVWTSSVGAGRLVVSGALDSWHYRDRGQSGFGMFWTDLVAERAAASPPALDLRLDRAIVGPGDDVDLRAFVRDLVLADVRRGGTWTATLSAAVESGDGSRADEREARPIVRLWPEAPLGVFSGGFRAPDVPGAYRVVVESDRGRAEAGFIVDTAARPAAPDERELLTAFASSRGGSAIDAGRLSELSPLLRSAFRPAPHVETWYPMRAPWWIVPFVLALGGEWWWRRRHGLA